MDHNRCQWTTVVALLVLCKGASSSFAIKPLFNEFGLVSISSIQQLILQDIANHCNCFAPQDTVFQLVAGSPVSVKQQITTPSTPFELSFDYKFETVAGQLSVLLNGLTLGTWTAPSTISDRFQTANVLVNTALPGQLVVLGWVLETKCPCIHICYIWAMHGGDARGYAA
jgi:hypothetical protein